ncbi:Fic family protein [uncultured Porphyromonas sp.]
MRNCLKELLEAGELEYTYPDMPRHPKQKYRTKV